MTSVRMRRQPEKIEQQHIVHLLRSIGGAVYVLGTRRHKGDHQGTMQTPGVPDLFSFLPPPTLNPKFITGQALWVEVKSAGGRLRPEQIVFRDHCVFSNVHHVVGGVDSVIAFLIAGGWLKADNVAHYRRPAPAEEVQREESLW